ncbi:MAG: MarR family transcriptional regulator [Clostridia bacterium]|nr:MarR family transcriptional regulator [Clostridia bacterium]
MIIINTLTKIATIDKKIANLHNKCSAKLLSIEELHFSQIPILFSLSQLGECTQCQIAEDLGISYSSVAVSLKRLEKNGYIKRTANENDLRYNKVSLTEKGVHSANQAKETLEKIIKRKFSGFSEEEQTLLLQFLSRMEKNLHDYLDTLKN